MLLGENTKTHYDILGVRENAAYEEIRASYRSSILETHPDKFKNSSNTLLTTQKSENNFVDVQKALEILGNSKSRAAYDCELHAIRSDFLTSEDVFLEDLTVEIVDENLELFYQCQCGDYYSISSPEFEQMGYKLLRDENKVFAFTKTDLPSSVLLSCCSCSLHVRLLINSSNVSSVL